MVVDPTLLGPCTQLRNILIKEIEREREGGENFSERVSVCLCVREDRDEKGARREVDWTVVNCV